MKISTAAISLAIFGFSTPVIADITVIPIDGDGIAYNLGPSNYENSPANYANSSSNYENSSGNYDNSPSNYENSSSNYDNGENGQRRLITTNNEIIGYYVLSKNGVLNLYGKNDRVGYMPGSGKTQSIFTSEGSAWCGTFGEVNGTTVIGMTKPCLLRFLLAN